MQKFFTLYFREFILLNQKHSVLLVVAFISSFSAWANPSTVKLENSTESATKLKDLLYSGSKAFGFTQVQNQPYLVVENLDKFPFADQLTFSYIGTPWRRKNPDGTYTPYNANHNRVELRLSNKGTAPLIINELSISNPNAWKIIQLNGVTYNASTMVPLTINSKGSVKLLIEFTASEDIRVRIFQDQLTINSNDNLTPNKKVILRGLWQRRGEGNNEPYAQEIIDAFGFKSKTGYGHDDGAIDGNSLVPNSDEVLAPYFKRVDASKPVYVIQMAAYHGCCSQVEAFNWYPKSTSTLNRLFRSSGLDGQSLLPRKYKTATEADVTLAEGNFYPTEAFGLKVGSANSDRSKNFENKIAMRIWKAIDKDGNIIPNAFIIGTDYLDTEFTNYDYQDNIYYISNVKPEEGTAYYSELIAAPSAVDFGSTLTGTTKTLNVNLSNLGQTYADGSKDPDIQISKVEIVGPTTNNKNSFSVTNPEINALAAGASTTISVSFNPTITGLRNAALLVYYNSANSPLRIPLYGIANQEATPITLVKRIKGASNTNLTIGEKVWEADTQYRKGSIKMDKQVIESPIASTDDDILYKTYLSAAANLAETRFEVPLANGEYGIRMHFVENYFSAVAARVFSITMEDELRLPNFDIYREVGYRSALVKDFSVIIKDDLLNIKFNPTADRVALAGIEIFTLPLGTVTSTEPDIVLPSNEKDLTLKIFPNPNNGQRLFVQLNNFGKKEEVTLMLHDPLGRQIQTETLKTDENGIGNKEIILQNQVQPGVYIIKAAATSGIKSARLIVK